MTNDTNRPQGLESPEKCTHCGEWIDTVIGMDTYTKVTDYTTTERTEHVYCNRLCLFQSLNPDTGSNGGDS
jgi:hypothetical protein